MRLPDMSATPAHSQNDHPACVAIRVGLGLGAPSPNAGLLPPPCPIADGLKSNIDDWVMKMKMRVETNCLPSECIIVRRRLETGPKFTLLAEVTIVKWHGGSKTTRPVTLLQGTAGGLRK